MGDGLVVASIPEDLRIIGRVRGRNLARSFATLAERFRLDVSVPVRKMSRGMRQKLGLILALAHDPRLLVLDEPTSGLDPLMQDELASCLRERAARGDTIFFSSHTLSEVESLCDQVAIVRDGRIVADETIDSLRARAHREVILVFEDEEQARTTAPPDFLVVRQRQGTTWTCELSGAARSLVTWAAGERVSDLTIGPPDLETIFRRFYAAEPGAN